MYLFIRDDLSHAQQIVQTAHAANEIGMKYPSENNHIVLCSAKNEEHLVAIVECLDANDIDHCVFYEPDIESHTAIATRPLRGNERLPLSKFQLKR
jgi:hypothetical protein